MFIYPEEPKEEVPDDVNEIIGDSTIKPLETHYFYMKLEEEGTWDITLPASKNKEIEDVLEWKVVGNRIKITWTAMRSGSFILHYGNYEKTVNVESLF